MKSTAVRFACVAGMLCTIGAYLALTFGSGCTTTPDFTIPTPSPSPDPNDMNSNAVGKLADFADPDSDFVTNDVYDVDGDIVQFDVDRNVLIWKATGEEVANWRVDEVDLIGQGTYRVRFGTEDGVHKAYWTEVGPATICDLRIFGILGLFISSTNTTVPNT